MNIKIAIKCGPCEPFIRRCVRSLQAQDDADWDAYVMVDPCGDRTFEVAAEAIAHDPRFHLHQNSERMYSMVNLIQAIKLSNAQSEDVIVEVDGDDWLNQTDAVRKIRSAYTKHHCWMTYGSWISNVPHVRGMWPAYPENTQSFRRSPWMATQIRTWKKWLWDLIGDEDLRDEHGRYSRYANDVAIMLPMLEMSGTRRAVHIAEPLLFYNRANPNCEQEVARKQQIRNDLYFRCKKSYPRVAWHHVGPVAPQNNRQEAARCATGVQLVAKAIELCNQQAASLDSILSLADQLKSRIEGDSIDMNYAVTKGVDILVEMGVVETHRNRLCVVKGAEARLAYYALVV